MNKEDILKIADEIPEFVWREGCGYESGVVEAQVLEFARRLLATPEQPKGLEVVGYVSCELIQDRCSGAMAYRDRQYLEQVPIVTLSNAITHAEQVIADTIENVISWLIDNDYIPNEYAIANAIRALGEKK